MAGRAHKRLQQQLGAQLPALAPEEEEEEGSEEEAEEAPRRAAFDLLGLLTDDEDVGRQSEDEEAEDEQPSSPQPPPPPRPAGAKQRSGKKKKKAAAKKKDDTQGEGGDAVNAAADRGAEEDLDQILRELNLQPAAPSAQQQQQQQAGSGAARPLLAVDMRQLKAGEELKRMFGSRVVEEDNEGGGGAYANASRRVRRLAARGLLKRAALRPGAIITPREDWPPFDGGFSMQAQGPAGGGKQQYGYVYSQAYQAVQELYEEAQASFDPNNVAALLGSQPYHLDALLTMHDLYRSTGDQAYAEEMLERALYALEMAWHPTFSPAAATAHVPYEEANAPLFTCLFRYMQSLGRRGLHRTALEVCKLLLAINADDPLGARFAIDYLALRAGRYDFLYRLTEEYGGDTSAALLPNFVFSRALARWYQEQEGSTSKGRGGGKGSGGSAGGEERPPSGDLLVRAVLLYPEAVVRLQRALADKGSARDARWAAVLAEPLFAGASDGGSASLAHLLDIWVERQHLMWKAQPIQDWLLAGCRRATTAPPEQLPDGLSAADWACVRQEAWPASGDNEYRHLRLHDYSDAVARLPPEEIHGWGGAGGGHAVDLAALEADMQALAAQARGADLTDEELRQQGPLAVLIRSLLPWVHLGQAPDYAADGDEQQQQQEQEQQDGQQQPEGGGQA